MTFFHTTTISRVLPNLQSPSKLNNTSLCNYKYKLFFKSQMFYSVLQVQKIIGIMFQNKFIIFKKKININILYCNQVFAKWFTKIENPIRWKAIFD